MESVSRRFDLPPIDRVLKRFRLNGDPSELPPAESK